MRKVVTLTGKNLPRLSVGKPGWPERGWWITMQSYDCKNRPIRELRYFTFRQLVAFTRVCEQTGLSERKD